jgi:hypothetical protein
MSRSLPAIWLDISRAKKRLAQLRSEEYQILLRILCHGCGAPVGCPCVKVCSHQKTWPHAERRRAAV